MKLLFNKQNRMASHLQQLLLCRAGGYTDEPSVSGGAKSPRCL